MKKEIRNKTKMPSGNIYLLKWLSLISICLVFGGVLSFAIILLSAQLIEKALPLRPIWIVGMIPMMTLVALPITMLIYRQLVKNLNPLILGMDKVAGGDLDTYIPTAKAKDFAKVYENFNKMVGEIQSVEILRTTMFDSLSHELKTPIASISGFSKLLLEKELTQEKQLKYLTIIAKESDRLDKLVKNILLLSKLDSQEIVSHKESYNLTAQIQECIIALEHEWSTKNLSLTADLCEVSYCSDANLIKIVWTNLLNNAIKFTPHGGEINVSMTEDEHNISIQFTDSGIGISEEDMEHIFERHYQVDKSHNQSGQGLGLSIIKRIMKLCGFSITVDSKPNEGSTFTVVLPK